MSQVFVKLNSEICNTHVRRQRGYDSDKVTLFIIYMYIINSVWFNNVGSDNF